VDSRSRGTEAIKGEADLPFCTLDPELIVALL